MFLVITKGPLDTTMTTCTNCTCICTCTCIAVSLLTCTKSLVGRNRL